MIGSLPLVKTVYALVSMYGDSLGPKLLEPVSKVELHINADGKQRSMPI